MVTKYRLLNTETYIIIGNGLSSSLIDCLLEEVCAQGQGSAQFQWTLLKVSMFLLNKRERIKKIRRFIHQIWFCEQLAQEDVMGVLSQNFAWEMSRGRARIWELWILSRYGMKPRSPTGGINEIF